MNKDKSYQSALKVNEGIAQPEPVNSAAINRLKALKRETITVSDYVKGILAGDMVLLSKAITLMESSLPQHQKIAQEVNASQ